MDAREIVANLNALAEEFVRELEGRTEESSLRALHAAYLGPKGRVTALSRLLGSIPAESRKEVGRAFNDAKVRVTGLTDEALAAVKRREEEGYLNRHLDLTLPGVAPRIGRMHPIRIVMEDIVDAFTSLGFDVAEGPEVETDWHNFGALNFPSDHPARDMQDTLFINPGRTLLRTHTSPVQVRTMLERPLPIQIVAPGAVYRRDDDPTHSPMFFQVEGLMIDEGVTFSDLKGVLGLFLEALFGAGVETRFRPSFFPFTEPSAECDIRCIFCRGAGCRLCKGTGWIEILGCGMVDPAVLTNVGIDAERYTGFAFGVGVERVAMLRWEGIPSIKLFYENDPRFLGSFRR